MASKRPIAEPASHRSSSTSARATRSTAPRTKLFVLDTNVLLHDPTSLFRFEEHDVFLPMQTLEELDANKRGVSEIARNARQVSRFLEEIIDRPAGTRLEDGFRLQRANADACTGHLYLQTEAINGHIPSNLPTSKADNQILGVVKFLQDRAPGRTVVLVSKDINMRIKARAGGLAAEDYFNDKVLEDTDVLYAGARELPADFWETNGQNLQAWKKDGLTGYRVTGPIVASLFINEFVYQGGDRPLEAWVRPSLLPDAAPGIASVVTVDNPSGSEYIEFRVTDGVPEFGLRTTGSGVVVAHGGRVEAGGTYHLVGTFDGVTARLFVNGVAVDDRPAWGVLEASGDLHVGSDPAWGRNLVGRIGDVAVYPVARGTCRFG